MSDAAVKIDPDFYNRRLLETETSVDQSRRAFPASATSVGGGPEGGIGMLGGAGRDGRGDGGYGAPNLPDYLVRQHSLLGLYLSLNPGDEGACAVSLVRKIKSAAGNNLSAYISVVRGTCRTEMLYEVVVYKDGAL